MRILITGAAGFIGSHLCDRFLAEGHRVIGVDNFLTGSRENLAHLRGHPRFTFIEQDVTEPFTVSEPLDAVLHFASPASPNPLSPYGYPNLPLETLKAGSLGTLHTLELARQHGAIYMLASTSEVYGDPEVHPQPETYWGHVNPVGERAVYDEAKRFAEALTMAYHRVYDLDTRIVRIFNTYGPRMRLDDGRVIPNFLQQALRREPLTVYGDGSQSRSFCYIDDLVEGIVRLLEVSEPYPVNLGNPQEITILELAERINTLTGNPAGVVFLPHQRGEGDPARRCPDITKARTLLHWEPRVVLEDGLRRTMEDFRRRMGL